MPFTEHGRIMAGTLIDISVKNVDLSVNDIIKKRDRTFAGKTAPAKDYFSWDLDISMILIAKHLSQIF